MEGFCGYVCRAEGGDGGSYERAVRIGGPGRREVRRHQAVAAVRDDVVDGDSDFEIDSVLGRDRAGDLAHGPQDVLE